MLWLFLCLCVACERRAADVHPASQGSGAAQAPAVVAPPVEGLDVVFILVDTMRADRLGASGYKRDGKSVTPNLDAFAQTAARFTHAYSQASNTPRSYPSIVTSRLPSQVKFHDSFHNFPAVLNENVTLPEVLASAGLHTTNISSHFYFERRRNLTQGFDEYDNAGAQSLADSNTDFAAPRITAKVVAQLEAFAAKKQRFAMFVHYFGPHSSYIEHPEFPTHQSGEAGLIERYDYEIAATDEYLGKVFETLQRTGLDRHTVVVVMSDHGEAFGTHRLGDGTRAFFHGNALYNEILRVPLLIRVPGITPLVNDNVVALLDVAPTIVDALGIAMPPSFTGRSLLPAMRGEALPSRDVRAELPVTPDWEESAQALVTGDGKSKILSFGEPRPRVEVYDLQSDPEEQHDLSKAGPQRTQDLLTRLSGGVP